MVIRLMLSKNYTSYWTNLYPLGKLLYGGGHGFKAFGLDIVQIILLFMIEKWEVCLLIFYKHINQEKQKDMSARGIPTACFHSALYIYATNTRASY